MSVSAKLLYRGAAATSSTTLYTVPSATTTVVTNIIVTNTAGSSGTFTLSLNGTALFTTATIAANSTALFDIKQPIAATQVIAGLASATTINFHISGVEIV